MPSLLTIFFVLFLFFSPSLGAANLHAIFVADTCDTTVGNAAFNDLEHMRGFAKKTAFYTETNLQEKLFQDREVLPENVQNYLEELTIEKEDLVIFYFSGHGRRSSRKGPSPWPDLEFSIVDDTLAFEWIQETLRAKNPHFLMMISDSCNTELKVLPALAPKNRAGEFLLHIKEHFNSLFLKHPGEIFVTSSSPGEKSWCSRWGSFFTIAFLQKFDEEMLKEEASWDSILLESSLQISEKQHPVYSIEFFE